MFGKIISLLLSTIMVFSSVPVTNNGAQALSGSLKNLINTVIDFFDGDDDDAKENKNDTVIETQEDTYTAPNMSFAINIQDFHWARHQAGNVDVGSDSERVGVYARLNISGLHGFTNGSSGGFCNIQSYSSGRDKDTYNHLESYGQAAVEGSKPTGRDYRATLYKAYLDGSYLQGYFYYDLNRNNSLGNYIKSNSISISAKQLASTDSGYAYYAAGETVGDNKSVGNTTKNSKYSIVDEDYSVKSTWLYSTVSNQGPLNTNTWIGTNSKIEQNSFGNFDADNVSAESLLDVTGDCIEEQNVVYVAEFFSSHTKAKLYSRVKFSIAYRTVDTSLLWNLYRAENNLNRLVDSKDVYVEGTLDDYEDAMTAARHALMGGVSQTVINEAYNDLLDAVKKLKFCIKFDYNDIPRVVEDYNIEIYTDVTVSKNVSATSPVNWGYKILSKNTLSFWPDSEEVVASGEYVRNGKYHTSTDGWTLTFKDSATLRIDANSGYQVTLQTLNKMQGETDHALTFKLNWIDADIIYRISFELNEPNDSEAYIVNPTGFTTGTVESIWNGDGSSEIPFPQIPASYHIQKHDATKLDNYYKFTHWSIDEVCGESGEVHYGMDQQRNTYSDIFTGEEAPTPETDSDGNTIYVVSETLYAHWAYNYIKVTYNINAPGGGSAYRRVRHGSTYLDKMSWTEYLDFDKKITLDNGYTFEGYDFNGWYLNNEKVTEYTPRIVKEEITFIAQWQKKCYKFEFNFNNAAETEQTAQILQDWAASFSNFEIKKDTATNKYYFIAYYGDYIAPIPTVDDGLMVDDTRDFSGWAYGVGAYSQESYNPVDMVGGFNVADFGTDGTVVTILAIWNRKRTYFKLYYNIGLNAGNDRTPTTIEGFAGDPLTNEEFAYFTLDKRDTDNMEKAGFMPLSNPWYKKDSSGNYVNVPTSELTHFPSENCNLYCGWEMKGLMDAVNRLDIVGYVSSFDPADYDRGNDGIITVGGVHFCQISESGDKLVFEKSTFVDVRHDNISGRYFLSTSSMIALENGYTEAKNCFSSLEDGSIKYIMFDCANRSNIVQAAKDINFAVDNLSFNSADYSKLNAWKEKFECLKVGSIDCLCRDSNGNESDLVWSDDFGRYDFTGGTILTLYDESDTPIRSAEAGKYTHNSFAIDKWNVVEEAKNNMDAVGSKFYYEQGEIDKLCYQMKKAVNNLELINEYDISAIREAAEYFFSNFVDLSEIFGNVLPEDFFESDHFPTDPDSYKLKVVTDGSSSRTPSEIGQPMYDVELFNDAKYYFADAYNIYWDLFYVRGVYGNFDDDQIQDIVFILNEMNTDIKKSERAGDYYDVEKLWDMYIGKIPDENGNYIDMTKLQLSYRYQFVAKYAEIMASNMKASDNDGILDEVYKENGGLKQLFDNMVAVSNRETFLFTIVDTQVNSQSITYCGSYGDDLTGYASYIPVRNGFEFGGWYADKELTKPYSFGLLLEDTTIYPKWVPSAVKYNLSVNVSGNGSIKLYDSTPTTNSINYSAVSGDVVTLTATPSKSAVFIGWQDAKSKKIISESEVYKFNIVSDTKLVALFASNADNIKVVMFKDGNGAVLSIQEVKCGASAVAPDISNSYISGYVFDKWDRDFSNITENTTVNAVYVKKDVSYKLETIGGIVINGVNPTNVKYNDYVVVSVDKNAVPKGKEFAGWSFDNGETVVSYNEEFGFCIIGNMTVAAVYADAVVEKTPTVIISEVRGENNKLSFVSTRSVDDSYRVIESGMLLTVNKDYADLLTLENASTYADIKLGKTSTPTNNGQYRVTVTATKGRTYYAVAYVVYMDADGNIKTVYSDRDTVTY